MRINRNVTHELFTTMQVDEIIVQPGDTVQAIIDELYTLSRVDSVVSVADVEIGVSLIFTRS